MTTAVVAWKPVQHWPRRSVSYATESRRLHGSVVDYFDYSSYPHGSRQHVPTVRRV